MTDVKQIYSYEGIDNKGFFNAHFDSDEEANAFRNWLVKHKVKDTLICRILPREEIVSKIQMIENGWKYLH